MTQGLAEPLEKLFHAKHWVMGNYHSLGFSAFKAARAPRAVLTSNRPDLVFFVLGSNNVKASYPETLAPDIREVVKMAGGARCWFVGPPDWDDDHRLSRVLGRTVAPCTFFDSGAVTLARGKDGIHPTHDAYKAWAQAIVDAMTCHAPPAAPSPPPSVTTDTGAAQPEVQTPAPAGTP
jgi:lysophospholipase L1-like esterase